MVPLVCEWYQCCAGSVLLFLVMCLWCTNGAGCVPVVSVMWLSSHICLMFFLNHLRRVNIVYTMKLVQPSC
jgi:hypothetical protein